ncbi:fungal-specific transcription factor domain-containing protein [Xylaria venustula]|nr:fungal-specific transcription factor domain-containing protein [Xylaria venustula]
MSTNDTNARFTGHPKTVTNPVGRNLVTDVPVAPPAGPHVSSDGLRWHQDGLTHLSLAATMIESPGTVLVNLQIDELDLADTPQYRHLSYPVPPNDTGQSLEHQPSCDSLLPGQFSLTNMSLNQEETTSPVDFYDWDILRASRMDWLGYETEASDAMTNESPRRPEDLQRAQPMIAAITGPPTQSLTNLLPTGSLACTKSTPHLGQTTDHHSFLKDQDNTETWPHVLDRGGNDSWPFDYASNRGFRKITLPPLRQVLEQTVGDRPAIESTTLMDLIKVLSCPQIPSFNDSPALEALPAVSFLGEFVKVYFAEFHPVAPIIHKPTWRIEKFQTALLAAMACIGATYSKAEGSQEVAALLAEITQTALFWMGQADSTAFRNPSYICASTFHQIYAMGTVNRRLYEIADASRGLLVTSLRGLGVLSSDTEQADPSAFDSNQIRQLDTAALESAWLEWRNKELEKRLAWSIFEFDCTLSTLTSKRGTFRVAELPSRLPCSENLWEAHSAHAWAAMLPFTSSPPTEVPFFTILRGIMMNKRPPDYVPAWGKRLCAHAIGRMLHDLREIEDISSLESLGLPSLATAHQETKKTLLKSLTLVQASLSHPVSTSDLVSMNIGSLGTHLAYLSSEYETMDLVVYIFRHSGRALSSQTTWELNVAKEQLRSKFSRDPVGARRSAHDAAAIICISRECTINTPCETMRVFMGYAFLLAFIRFFPFQNIDIDNSGAALVVAELDGIPWTRSNEARDRIKTWIGVGGVASLQHVGDVCDPRNFEALKQNALDAMDRLRVWGLSSKFRKTINNLV